MLELIPDLIFLIAAIYFFAGISKGIVGLGLPTIGIGFATIFLGLDQALAIATLPVLLSNVYQAVIGGHLKTVLVRTWPLLLTAAILTWAATGLIVLMNPAVLTIVLGSILIAYSILSLTTPTIPPPGRHEVWLGPVAGVVTGVITGVTGSSAVPGALYLQSLGLARDAFVQSLGLLFSATYVGLTLGLGNHAILTGSMTFVSALAVIPAFLGMAIGIRLRKRIPEKNFRKVFLGAIMVLGAYLIVRSVGSL